MTKYIFIFLIALIFYGCSLIPNYPQDNPLEELVEDVIQKETGLQIDLSPQSPDPDTLKTP